MVSVPLAWVGNPALILENLILDHRSPPFVVNPLRTGRL